MAGITHNSDARCPDCGCAEAIVRVRGNAISSVCSSCRRVDVAPMLDDDDLAMVTPEIEGALFELDAVRYGDPTPLQSLRAAELTTKALTRELERITDETIATIAPYLRDLPPVRERLQVELRLPVPTR